MKKYIFIILFAFQCMALSEKKIFLKEINLHLELPATWKKVEPVDFSEVPEEFKQSEEKIKKMKKEQDNVLLDYELEKIDEKNFSVEYGGISITREKGKKETLRTLEKAVEYYLKNLAKMQTEVEELTGVKIPIEFKFKKNECPKIKLGNYKCIRVLFSVIDAIGYTYLKFEGEDLVIIEVCAVNNNEVDAILNSIYEENKSE